MRKALLTLVSILAALPACFGQVNAGNDTIICVPGPVTLTATVANNNPGTTSYSVSQINYTPFPYNTGTLITNCPNNCDDEIVGPYPIGFNFCFFGNTYSQFYISTNGFITFSPGQPAWCSSTYPIPNTNNFNVPWNCIMVWEDYWPGNGGNMRWTTVGTAPNRKLIVTFENVDMYGLCSNNQVTFQFICYETSNLIDININNKPQCIQQGNGTAVEGIHNANGTAAFAVPGRNSTVWSATNDAYRFTPNGPPSPYTIAWYDIGWNNIGNSASVTPNVTSNTSYYAVATYSCSNSKDTDTVNVTIGIPASVSSTNSQCPSPGTGTATVTTTAGSGYTYAWSNGATASSVSNLSPGTYTVTVTYGTCTWTNTVTITGPPAFAANLTSVQDTCGKNTGAVTASISGGTSPYTYQWNNGMSTATITGLAGGTYTVTVTDVNACTFQTSAIVSTIAPPTADFMFTPSSVTLLDPLATFTNLSSGGISWFWDFGDGNTSTLQNPTHVYTTEGTYIVMLVVTNAAGCKDTVYKTMIVEGYYTFYVPNCFTPNGDMFNQTWGASFYGIDVNSFELRIFDRWGEQIFYTKDPYDWWAGRVENVGPILPNGVYVYKFYFRDFKQSEHWKIGHVTLLR